MKKFGHCHDLVEVGDDEAMQKILVDICRRNARSDKWLQVKLEGEEELALRYPERREQPKIEADFIGSAAPSH